ncbi:MAG: serine/threonine protein kinase [Planctomycetes bacterium]|nr:serine/threonine protein kinase [Planctomycetota bacterium]
MMFGRACLSFGLIQRDPLLACVAQQRNLIQHGHPVTLAQVMIGRGLISAEQYQHVAERIRAYQGQQQSKTPPSITASGRYPEVPTPPANPPLLADAPDPSEDDLELARRSWEDASSVVDASEYDVIAAAPPRPSPTRRMQKDAGIRKILGVPLDAESFDFGPYRILSEVAAGGMGVIYRAQGPDGNLVALKALINVEHATDQQLKRFIQEAQSAQQLDHPGIVKIHDLGINETIPFFTMDLVEGQDLQHHLRHKTFPLDVLLEIFRKVGLATHYAHEHGVIHRDLKPANIIVRDLDTEPVLTDFGLAKNLDSTFKLTAEGAMVGTPLFLSPEQVSGKAAEVDRRCDVYGLGVMLYQILTDTLPFLGRNPYEVYRKVLETDPVPPSEHNAAISKDLETICLMALAKSPDERYPTTLELSEDIRRALNGESVLAKLPTPVEGKESAKVKSSRKSKTKLSTKGKKQTAKEKRASARFADSSYLGARPAVGSDNTLWLWIAIAVCSVLIVLALGYVVYALWISPA